LWVSARMQAWEIATTIITPNLRTIIAVTDGSGKEGKVLLVFQRVLLGMWLFARRIWLRECCGGKATETSSKSALCLLKWRAKQHTSPFWCSMMEMKPRCQFESIQWSINIIINPIIHYFHYLP
jgi:hypothetical protein